MRFEGYISLLVAMSMFLLEMGLYIHLLEDTPKAIAYISYTFVGLAALPLVYFFSILIPRGAAAQGGV
jgi:hypothetical protein